MKQELLDLYEELKLLENQEEDLGIYEPDELDEQEYICFEQEIIHYNNGIYDISCLYDSHPTLKFESIEEVVAYFIGYTNANFDGFKIWVVGDNMDKEENAYNIGYYYFSIRYIRELEKDILPKFINKRQYRYSINKANLN